MDRRHKAGYPDTDASVLLLIILITVCAVCLIIKVLPGLLTKEVWQAEAIIRDINYYAPSRGETFATYIVEYEGASYTLPSIPVSNISQFTASDRIPIKCTLYMNDYLDLELVITP